MGVNEKIKNNLGLMAWELTQNSNNLRIDRQIHTKVDIIDIKIATGRVDINLLTH